MVSERHVSGLVEVRMEPSRGAQRTSIWVMWFLTAFAALEVHQHRDAFTFWIGIVMLALMLPLAFFSTYRRLVEARGALSREKGLNVS